MTNANLSQASLRSLAALVVSPETELLPSIRDILVAAELVDDNGATPEGVNLVVTLAMASSIQDEEEELDDAQDQELLDWAGNVIIEFTFVGTRYSVALFDLINATYSVQEDILSALEEAYDQVQDEPEDDTVLWELVADKLLQLPWETLRGISISMGQLPCAALDYLKSITDIDEFDLAVRELDLSNEEVLEEHVDHIENFDEDAFIEDLVKRVEDIGEDIVEVDPDVLEWARAHNVHLITEDTFNVEWLPRVVVRIVGQGHTTKAEVLRESLTLISDLRDGNTEELLEYAKKVGATTIDLVKADTEMTSRDVLRMISQENDNVQNAKLPREYDKMPAVTSV